jgi:hypothetical protein
MRSIIAGYPCRTGPNDFSETLLNSHTLNVVKGGWDVIADGERKKMFDTPQQYARDDVAALEAQIEELKQAIVLLQAQLGEMRKQRDRWQSRAERISLVSVG